MVWCMKCHTLTPPLLWLQVVWLSSTRIVQRYGDPILCDQLVKGPSICYIYIHYIIINNLSNLHSLSLGIRPKQRRNKRRKVFASWSSCCLLGVSRRDSPRRCFDQAFATTGWNLRVYSDRGILFWILALSTIWLQRL